MTHARWVDTEKRTPSGLTYKSRLVLRGDRDIRTDLTTATGACPHDSIRWALQAAMSHPNYDPKNIRVIDAENAYLQADLDQTDPVFIRPPIGHPDRGQFLWQALKAIYGLKDAGNAWHRFATSKIKQLGYVICLDGVYIKYEKGVPSVLLVMYVDDFILIGYNGSIDNEEALFRRELKLKPSEPLTRHVGVDYIVEKEKIVATQSNYAKQLPKCSILSPQQPLPNHVVDSEDVSDILSNPIAQKNYRSNLGALSYLAHTTRPDINFATTFLSKYNVKPTARSRELLDNALAYARATSASAITLKRITSNNIRVQTYCDASLGSHNNVYANSGIIVLVNNTPIHWVCHKQPRVARSSTRAELIALQEAVDYLLYIKPFLQIFWKNVQLEIYTDSNDTLSLIKSVNPKPTERSLTQQIRSLADKTLVLPVAALSENFTYDGIVLCKVHTSINLADCLTKPMDVSPLRLLIK